ncbi:hypothetical protein ACFYU8_18665 [Brevibacillus sp. NPDC003359]|uniref:hypothetical protein n=1 Tax=unclassified Brevibacillus TaxID=2684853 RepID=UPI0036D05015
MAVMHFTYDPIYITRTLLQRYVEKFVEDKFYNAKQFACYEFLHTMTDKELEGMLRQYVKDHSLECITFDKAWEECALIYEYVYKCERYKALEFDFKKRGYGLTGMGVVDNSDSTFYDCGFTQHWPTVVEIMKEKYPVKAEALDELMCRAGKEEHNGISRADLDDFILHRFELIGGNKDIEYYLD